MLEKLAFFVCAIAVALALPYPEVKNEEANVEVDICSLPPVNPSPVACSGVIPRYTYNASTETCEKFIYGGCFGTKNLFKNEFACLSQCNKQGLQKLIEKSDPTLPCMQPKSTGTCRAIIPSFYFDTATGECTEFTYTGCGGNANNFKSAEECDLKCNGLGGPVRPPPSADDSAPQAELTKQERCSLPPIKSDNPFGCLAFIPSWTFNSTVGQCESFVYGGCGKTANLFDSEEACNTACGPEPRLLAPRNRDTCLLPIVKGPCFAAVPKYAFVKEKNRCELFTYGGCQGNKNNFATADECYKTCGGDLPSTTLECAQVDCPVSNNRFIERGCRPEYKGKSCCPIRFVCPEEESVEGVCLYRGVFYNIGEEITQLSEDDGCKTGCKCVQSDKHRGGATIKCNQIYCDMPFLPHEGCVLVTEPGQCCPSYRCPEKEKPNQPRDDVCVFNGVTYLKGQFIPTGLPCRRCNCVDGFNGLDGPGCRDVHCVVDNRIGCVPVYTAGVCCPISYKCLDDSELSQNKTRIIRRDRGEDGSSHSADLTLPRDLNDPNDPRRPALCYQPKAIGLCRMSEPSFYYDAQQDDCLPFIYGGCQGNENRFSTAEACLATCGRSEKLRKTNRIIRIESEKDRQGVMTLPIQLAAENPLAKVSTLPIRLDGENAIESRVSRPSQCLQPKKTGPCRGLSTFYFFDVNKEKCVAFNYGGCEGNDNRFPTMDECRKTCNDQSEKVSEPNVCDMPVKVGPCRGMVFSYFYNKATGACESFGYGGCKGNGNRFSSVEECQATCVNKTLPSLAAVRARSEPNQEDKLARCKLPSDVGMCKAVKERYFYDSADKECKVFTYGGCMGNANNFRTKEECLTACNPDDTVTDAVTLTRARARARARTSLFEEAPVVQPSITNVIDTTESACRFGNLTLKLGERLIDSVTPCDECICSTPPELTCVTKTCPAQPVLENAFCQAEFIPGECCPSYSCVSSNPPSINVCKDVVCDHDEHCEVQAQESKDGSWLPPIGVCIKDSTSIPL